MKFSKVFSEELPINPNPTHRTQMTQMTLSHPRCSPQIIFFFPTVNPFIAPMTNKYSLLEAKLESILQRRNAQGRLRTLRASDKLIDFSSNDYLSLGRTDCIKQSYIDEVKEIKFLGSGGSRLLDGNSLYMEDLEDRIAHFHNGSAGLFFNSGYEANVSVFTCIPQPGDWILYDEYIHASVHDGMKFSRAQSKPFAHNSVRALQKCIEDIISNDPNYFNDGKSIFVAVEGVYSMDGDTAPIESICELTKRLIPEGHCYIIVDEAHSTGVIGSQGKGLVCQKGLEDHIFIRLHTFGKAVHASGSIVICSKITKQYLVNYARPLIYSTAMTFSNLALIKCHYDYLASPEAPLQIETLWERVSYFYHKTNQLATISSGFISLPLPRPQSSIFALICPKSKSLAKFCQDKGVMVRAIVYPTVPKGLERVRVCIHAANTVEDIDFLVSSIEEWLRLEASRSVRL